MTKIDDNHGRLLADNTKTPRRNTLLPGYILEVMRIPAGEKKGEFGVIGSGLNDQGEHTIVEIYTSPVFLNCLVIYEYIRTKVLKVEDVPNFEIRRKDRLAVRQRFAKLLQ